MCPSWRVTHEEEHSTRGRAHLLWEMTQGRSHPGRVASEDVKHSLDLCLACKGCKSDCPVRVDLATYKAEFLSHYYEGRLRPLSAYAFGNIDLLGAPGVECTRAGEPNDATPIPARHSEAPGRIPAQRKIPAFAPETFKQWFRRTSPSRGRLRWPREAQRAWTSSESPDFVNLACTPDRSEHPQDNRSASKQSGETGNDAGPPAHQVILWADTFNNYFLPSTAKAAVEVLETAGFRVLVPRANLCCGRPLYDFGMLDRAERLLLEILDQLEPEIEAGIPIVGLEPSCVAVFRDELINLFPHDKRAQALRKQTFLLSEFLEQRLSPNAQLPQLPRQALLHGHCHHKSIMKMTAEESLLGRLGVQFQSPAPGCCGMAGSFGFEADKYEVSAAIGELELLPAVRQAPGDWLIIADGFSCREQIAQGTGRHALHLAEVLQMALQPSALDKDDPYPESRLVRERQSDIQASMQRAGIGLGALAAGSLLVWAATRKR